MYLAVVSLIVGQALFLGEVSVLGYGGAVWLCFHLFVLAYEEPTLRRTFGAEYARFCANVARWLPRLRPWRAESSRVP
jgi:protein-S-isoprenylcysteine O-methyltransferase Ste14